MNGKRKKGNNTNNLDRSINRISKDQNTGTMTEKWKSYRSGRLEIRKTPRAIKVSSQAAASWLCSSSSRDATAAHGSGSYKNIISITHVKTSWRHARVVQRLELCRCTILFPEMRVPLLLLEWGRAPRIAQEYRWGTRDNREEPTAKRKGAKMRSKWHYRTVQYVNIHGD